MKPNRRDLFRWTFGTLVASALPRVSGARGEPVKKSAVGLVKGEDRRRNVYEALKLVDDQIAPGLKAKDYVVIKPNCVSMRNPLASTQADALRGILDFLEPYKKPVVIAESSAGNTMYAYEEFGYFELPKEYPALNVKLVDLNEEAEYEVFHILDGDLHPAPIRLAKRLLDPDAFVLCAPVLKTHNTVVATLSVKNMALGAPLRSAPGETPQWNDKRVFHGGVRQTHYDIMLTAQKLRPSWGATVIDGFEGMEGNGPSSGTPVPSRIAVASTDYIAADRIGVEAMSINPDWVGYLKYCEQVGVGHYSLERIELRGEDLANVRKSYALHQDIERQLRWMGPMTELPPKLG
ncbi:MAG: hypothetical protein Kow00109_06480 [Acidobacteriota bacterium]